MANTIVNSDVLLEATAIALADELTISELSTRNYEAVFGNAVGDKVNIQIPNNFGVAGDLISDGTINTTDIDEVDVDLEITEQPYQSVTATTLQRSLGIKDFMRDIAIPVAKSISRQINASGMAHAAKGFARYLSGTDGTRATTLAHLAACRQQLKDNRCDMSDVVGLLDTTTTSNFNQLDAFASSDYGVDGPQALRDGKLGSRLGIDFYESLDIGNVDQGVVAGTVLVDGAGAVGDTTLHVDGFTAATGTVKEGTRFTIAGTSTIYTVTADTAYASNECTLPIFPALTAIEADNDGITFKTAFSGNILYNPAAFAMAIVTPTITSEGTQSVVTLDNGVSLRLTKHVSESTLAGRWTFDVLTGYKVLEPKFGCILQG